jgi:hypothetical protein
MKLLFDDLQNLKDLGKNIAVNDIINYQKKFYNIFGDKNDVIKKNIT